MVRNGQKAVTAMKWDHLFSRSLQKNNSFFPMRRQLFHFYSSFLLQVRIQINGFSHGVHAHAHARIRVHTQRHTYTWRIISGLELFPYLNGWNKEVNLLCTEWQQHSNWPQLSQNSHLSSSTMLWGIHTV